MGPNFNDGKNGINQKKNIPSSELIYPIQKSYFWVDDVQFSLSVGYGLVPSRLAPLISGAIYNPHNKSPIDILVAI